MTSQGQTILVFIGITGLVIPQLVLVIAPIALVIAVAHVLNKLAADSEIIVMNDAGMSPWRLFRAFFASAGIVAVLVAVVSAYVAWNAIAMGWLTTGQTTGSGLPLELTFYPMGAGALLMTIFAADIFRRRSFFAIVAGIIGVAFGLLFWVLNTLPATVPVALALGVDSWLALRRRRMPLTAQVQEARPL